VAAPTLLESRPTPFAREPTSFTFICDHYYTDLRQFSELSGSHPYRQKYCSIITSISATIKRSSTTMDQAPAKELTVNKERKCEGADCSNDAGSLQCPTCQKLGKEAFFCTQDCFKRNWVGQYCDFEYLVVPALYICSQRGSDTDDITHDRQRIKRFTRRKTVCYPTSLLPASYPYQTQMATSTRSRHILSLVP
jgi:hypothetical protein